MLDLGPANADQLAWLMLNASQSLSHSRTHKQTHTYLHLYLVHHVQLDFMGAVRSWTLS